MSNSVDEAVASASREYVGRLGQLSNEPYIREAVMKLAVRETALALLKEFDDQYGLADQLELMAQLLRHRDRGEEEETDG